MSASNNRFELAVAVPILNNSFKFPNRFSFIVSSISGNTITVGNLQTESNSSILNVSEVLAAGDRITLQSSSGTRGSTLISSVSSTGMSFIVEDNMSSFNNTASSGVGYGSVCPGGWYLVNFYPGSGYTFTKELGNNDGFSASLYIPEKSSSGTTKTFDLSQSIPTTFYVPNLKYRMGCVSKITITPGAPSYNCGLSMILKTNLGNTYGNIYTSNSSNVTSFTSTGFTVYRTDTSITFFVLDFLLASDAAYATKATKVFIDDVYLEHVYNPITKKTIYDESPSTASTYNPYYEIEDNYDSGSLTIEKIDSTQELTLEDGSILRYDSTGWGERNVKYEISCKFTNVSVTIWKYLSKLLDIQKNGYKLNLHPYISELPEVLTGYLYISGISKEHWDVGLVSFNFRFREA